MSGTNLAEQEQDAARSTTSTAASEDYAASLRAAALMTLKSKRRKATTVQQAEPMPPHRFLAAPPSIELDYGQEEPTGASSIASSPAVAPAKPATPPSPAPEPMDVDDSPAREEGEISESEAPPTPKGKPEPMSPVLGKTDPVTLQKVSAPRAITPAPVMPAVPTVLPLLPHETADSAVPTVIDENHVRPGLALTQAQYDTAKDIILDLLGWGVPPEYLVNCGLSREMVYYVFVELNLRLPSNLDTTGLPPVPPPLTSQAGPSKRASLSHPSLPPKPQPATELSSKAASAPHPLSAAAAPFVPLGPDATSITASSSSVTLNDMEQQRRQELLARKAVLASRKSKQKGTSSSSDMATLTAAAKEDNKAVVPPKIVDDFLQSIEPGVPTGTRNGTASLRPPRGLYDMDVDDVPGLTTRHDPITEYTPLRRPPPPPPPPKSAAIPDSTSPRSPTVPRSAVSSASDRSYPPSSTLSFASASLSYGGDDDDTDVIPGLFQTPTPPEDDKPTNSRRGTKRPVAADFVDLEPGPSKGQARGPPDFFRAKIRRRTAGFAGLTQRRCVIDLSDSEDDDMGLSRPVHAPSRTDSRGPKAATLQTTAAPTPRQHSPAIHPVIAPSILQEKEEEIRRMRELIAQREQNRKRKLAASSRSTPSSSVTPTNGVVTIKQEDDESAGVRSLGMSRSTSSATPDPTSYGRPYDSQDERSVLDALLPHDSSHNGTVSLPDSASTSSATTPIDVTSRPLEHPTTGDKVLTDEARHEQVVSEAQDPQSHHVEVDVVGAAPETSAQVPIESQDSTDVEASEQAPAFPSYRSLLDYHPLLREHSRQDSTSKISHDVPGSGPSSMNLRPSIDLEPLKQSAVMKFLSSGSGRICQYEVPGGGECRDQNCEDVHLSRLSTVEPSDEDTAQFLCSSIPVGPRYGVKAFRDALDVARLRHPTMSFDARVQEALSSLGLR